MMMMLLRWVIYVTWNQLAACAYRYIVWCMLENMWQVRESIELSMKYLICSLITHLNSQKHSCKVIWFISTCIKKNTRPKAIYKLPNSLESYKDKNSCMPCIFPTASFRWASILSGKGGIVVTADCPSKRRVLQQNVIWSPYLSKYIKH